MKKWKWILCSLALGMIFAGSPATASEPIDMRAVAIQSNQITILEAEGEAYSLVAVGEVTLDCGLVVGPGEDIYVGDVLEGTVRNDGNTVVWVADANGDEYEILPGEVMAIPCMKGCTCSGCPSGLGCHCHAIEVRGRNCCACDCEAGPYPHACSCTVAEPA